MVKILTFDEFYNILSLRRLFSQFNLSLHTIEHYYENLKIFVYTSDIITKQLGVIETSTKFKDISIEEFNELDRIYTVLDKFRIADNKKEQINLDFD